VTRSTIKLRPQEPEIPERKVRLRLPGRLAADLDEYRDLYARAHGQEIELTALIEGILEQFLASDRAFQRLRRTSSPADERTPKEPHGEDLFDMRSRAQSE
jgi:hypothetical protein